MPAAAKANPISTQTGTASTIHGDPTIPSAHIVSTNATE